MFLLPPAPLPTTIETQNPHDQTPMNAKIAQKRKKRLLSTYTMDTGSIVAFWTAVVLVLTPLFRDVFEARHPSCSTVVVGVFHSSQHHGPRRAACFASKSHPVIIHQERHQRLASMRHTDKSVRHSLWSSHPTLLRLTAARGGGGGVCAPNITPSIM